MRACPFCGSTTAQRFGHRHGAQFLRCRSCRSIYRDLDVEAFERLHEQAFEEDDFLDRVVAGHGTEPASQAWDRLDLPGSTVLEIGPGAGHLLAGAAVCGRRVMAVETSARHRAFIREMWGIDTLFESIDDLPADLAVDAVVAINVLEHVYDIASFLKSIRRHLVPGGNFFFSTPNAEALVCSMAKTQWSMFKEPDHVSFPSRAGACAAALEAGVVVERVWSDEMAFETPVGLGVAARDLWRERYSAAQRAYTSGPANDGGATITSGGGSRALAKLNGARWARYEPSSLVCARLGRAGTVKAMLRRPLT